MFFFFFWVVLSGFVSNSVNMQALDTLGNTKWRVNRRILNVVENLWAAGGDVAGLVNRKNVSAPTVIFFYFPQHPMFPSSYMLFAVKILNSLCRFY